MINNTAIVIGESLEFSSIKSIHKQFGVNLFGMIKRTQTFLPLLRKVIEIINISFTNGWFVVPFLGTYCATKFALEAITASLRMELKRWNIPVSIIDPNLIKTKGWDKAIKETKTSFKSLSNEAKLLYENDINNVIENAIKSIEKAKPPLLIAKELYRALNAKKPKPRYLPGFDAKISNIFNKILPNRMLYNLLIKEMGIK